MWTYFVVAGFLFQVVLCEEKSWTVSLEQGSVKGVKFWDGDYYEFYGIPYATVPKGKDRFKGPLPPVEWEGEFDASEKNKYIMCPQLASFDAEPSDHMVVGTEECLVANVFPHAAARKSAKPLPVIVYFHGGAYSNGYGSMASYKNILRHEVIVVSFNYRVGALGFLCLGTEDIPGNAGLRDQIELLKWVQTNIRLFNGDPSDVTVAGYTVGASSAELLMLSGAADGLFNKVISDSGSAISPWAIDNDPVNTAKSIAESMGYSGDDDVKNIESFYQKQSTQSLMSKSVHIWNPNSTFAFAPCVEKKIETVHAVLTEDPLTILKEGKFKKLPLLTGFANMEGISRLVKYDDWKNEMDDNFQNFLPADINIKNVDEKSEVINRIKKFYFGDKTVKEAGVQAFVNYFSDAMFSISILRSVHYHCKKSTVYLYEFSYVGRLSSPHSYPEINGASHRDQTAHMLNFGLAFTQLPSDLLTRERMTTMWTNFAIQGKPIPKTTELLDEDWAPFTVENENFMTIDEDLVLRSKPLEKRFELWTELYDKYHRDPVLPNTEHRWKIEL